MAETSLMSKTKTYRIVLVIAIIWQVMSVFIGILAGFDTITFVGFNIMNVILIIYADAQVNREVVCDYIVKSVAVLDNHLDQLDKKIEVLKCHGKKPKKEKKF